MFARPKLSYAPPNLPVIWFKRTGFTFEHVTEIPVSDERRAGRAADQVLRYLESELKRDMRYTQRDLDARSKELGMTRAELRAALATLQVSGRVIERPLPSQLCQGARQKFLCPAHCAEQSGAVGPERVE